MYPNLYYFFKDVFGVSIPALKIVNMFGFCVALAFLIAAWLLAKELKRKQANGLFSFEEINVTIGDNASVQELLLNFLLGFVFGYKILAVFFIDGALKDPQSFIFSSQGSWLTGIGLGLIFAGLRWWDKYKTKLAKPEQRTIRIWPSDRVGDITIIAAAAGFIGAKIFDNLENWDRFVQDPIGNLLSPSGLTFYGGLIVATFSLWYYFSRHKIGFISVADASAPSLMLSYGLGRIGCQMAGDGDWGILNSAYLSDANGKLISATQDQFNAALQVNNSFYTQQFGSLQAVQHAHVHSFWGLPDWMFAFTYTHNVNKEGIPMHNCNWDDFCNHLPLPVFPTPLYEIIMSVLLFAFLWSIRKKIITPGRMFAVYLFVNGLERFLIEKIRVNTTYSIGDYHPTQAEIISSLLMLTGIVLYYFAPKIKVPQFKKTE